MQLPGGNQRVPRPPARRSRHQAVRHSWRQSKPWRTWLNCAISAVANVIERTFFSRGRDRLPVEATCEDSPKALALAAASSRATITGSVLRWWTGLSASAPSSFSDSGYAAPPAAASAKVPAAASRGVERRCAHRGARFFAHSACRRR